MGSTGSIGKQALEVLSMHPDKFELAAISAHLNTELFLQQLKQYRPKVAAITGYSTIDTPITPACKLFCGQNALEDLLAYAEFDYVIVALVGMAGLQYVLKCLQMGKRILLANKEALVAGGKIVLEAAQKASEAAKTNDAYIPDATFCSGEYFSTPLHRILPIDSEHSAIFQCINSVNAPIDRIFLTCSGGPFRTWEKERILNAGKQDALKHPKWNMGAKITIDSASLFNKALEIIEAKYLFGVDESKIQVLIHPQSIVHSMVGFADKGIIAQMGIPSMKLPILYSMSYPERMDCGIEYPDLSCLEFSTPDTEKFPALAMVRECLRRDDAGCAILNAANEVAVEYFLQDRIRFGDISNAVAHTLEHMECLPASSFEEVVYADKIARILIKEFLDKR